MKTVLVTGSNGYVGQVVAGMLRGRGVSVTGLGTRGADMPDYIAADISDHDGLMGKLKGRGFDAIIHAASLANDTGDPRQMVSVNIVGLQNVLEFARMNEGTRVVIASSLSALEWYPATRFEPPKYLPVDEKHPANPKNIYSSTKLMQEILGLTYYHQYKVPVSCVRLTAVVGPNGQGGGSGYREIAKAMKGGRSVQVPHFSAEDTCHYVDIRDAARLLIECAENPAADGEVFNCCGADAMTSGADFEAIMKKLVPGIEVEFNFPWSMAQGGVVYFSMEKAKRVLGYEPVYTLEDSLASIKEWYEAGGLEATEERAGIREGVVKN